METHRSDAAGPPLTGRTRTRQRDSGGAGGVDSDPESFPILVRSMSTSRRHSWSVPVSPLEPGRRLSLETPTVESDGEREDGCSPQSLTCPPDLGQSFSFPESPRDTREGQNRPPGGKPKKPNKPGRSSSLRSEILVLETSQAARVSRVLETSKRAAGSTGAEGQELGVSLQTKEGQSHVLMVQTVLQELKQYHGVKQRTASRGGEEHSSDVTWFEFLSNDGPGAEEEQAEKLERGAKVRRTLSSLRNRVTGSFTKDKGKQKEQQKERERDRELKEKERLSSYGHQLVPGTFSSWTTCSVCCKSLQGKQQCLQCLKAERQTARTIPDGRTQSLVVQLKKQRLRSECPQELQDPSS
ncbi:hypothetical protein MATL_G00239150 [Megalops atlanticus]|uniref:Uncharacterized protein n=1 Tax=Megalops atlanticus TaxID=7932 RepID=A0A9D3PC18_MEGAT|nr:hypothetical protein MATL_G00239150 [Megalops atlanticus]